MGLVSPSQVNPGDEITSASVNTPINQLAAVVNGSLDSDNISSLTGAKIQSSTLTGAAPDSTYAGGWLASRLPAVSSVTNNGNGSETMTFASTVASTLSPGMRLEVTKTVAGNGYMGGLLNGSSHYFTKATPSGTLGTVTNNFTFEANVELTTYPSFGGIMGRSDASPANGIIFDVNSSGQVRFGVYNGGAANYRIVSTYHSLPLNKKAHVAASWASGTVVIYFNGKSVPVGTATTGGTAPTTAGTGGDFSIGRTGANTSSYLAGYVSNAAVFDAVLSAATIAQHATYKLTGSETNCIGAWSLDNTANDQSSAGNNLTATGGVGYTARSPHGTLGSGINTSKAVALVMSVSTTDVVCQVPEGCTIPTTGGITSVAYSTTANPYGWVTDRGKWRVQTLNRTDVSQAAAASTTWYNLGSTYMTVPIGAFIVGYKTTPYGNRAAAGAFDVQTSLSTSSSAANDDRFTCYSEFNNVTAVGVAHYIEKPLSLSAATIYYLNTRTNNASTTTLYNFGARGETEIFAIPAGL